MQRCTAHSKRSGKPCKSWAIRGGTVCVWHGGAAPQVKAKAVERLKEARDLSLAKYVEYVGGGQVDATLALSASLKLTEMTEVLEGRVGSRGGIELDAAAGARDLLALHLARLAERRGSGDDSSKSE